MWGRSRIWGGPDVYVRRSSDPTCRFTVHAWVARNERKLRIRSRDVRSTIILFFTELNLHSFSITIAIVLLTSIAFSLAGLINAIFAEKFDDIAIIPTFVLTPLIYLGGVFYSTDMLPEFWQKVSAFNPILYMVNTFRYGMLGESDINIFYAFSILIVFILILFFISLHLLNKGTGIKN